MRIARVYTFELEFLKPAKLPRWKGNLIRGAFGLHLKRMYCMNDLKNCHSCHLLFKCPYGYLFRATTKGIVLRKNRHYTKPYVIKPPLESKTEYDAKDILKFSIVLYGDAMAYENQVFHAINSMCRSGLGFRDCRGMLRIRRVTVENPFRNEKGIMFEDGEFFEPKIYVRDSDLNVDVRRVFKIEFLTPFRLIKNGALISDPDFGDLFSFMLRKYSAIRYQYLGLELDLNVEDMLERAKRIVKISSDLSRRTFVYKNKEETFLHGSITYSGKLKARMRKVLAFCHLSHVGKRSSYGHGWFEVT